MFQEIQRCGFVFSSSQFLSLSFLHPAHTGRQFPQRANGSSAKKSNATQAEALDSVIDSHLLPGSANGVHAEGSAVHSHQMAQSAPPHSADALFNSPGNVIPLPPTAASLSMCNVDVARGLPISPVRAPVCVAFIGDSCNPSNLSEVEQAKPFVGLFGAQGTGEICAWAGMPDTRVDIVVFSATVQNSLHWKSPKGRVSDAKRKVHEQLTRLAQVLAAWGVRVVTTKWLAASVSARVLQNPDRFEKKLRLGIQTYVPKSLPEVHDCAWLHTPSIVVGHELCILWRTKENPTPHWRQVVCTDYNPQERYFTVQAQDTMLFTDLPLEVMGDMRICRDVLFNALSNHPRRLLGCAVHVLCPSSRSGQAGQEWLPAIVYAYDESTSEFCLLLGKGTSERNVIKADLRFAPVMCKGVGLPFLHLCDQQALFALSEGKVMAVATEVLSDEEDAADASPAPLPEASTEEEALGAGPTAPAAKRPRGRPRLAAKAAAATASVESGNSDEPESSPTPTPRSRGRGRPRKQPAKDKIVGAKTTKKRPAAAVAPAAKPQANPGISARVMRELGDTLQPQGTRLADDAVATEVLAGAPQDAVPPPLDADKPLADLLPRHVTGLMPSLFDPREPTVYLHAKGGSDIGSVLPSLPPASHPTHTVQPHAAFHSGAAPIESPFLDDSASPSSSPAADARCSASQEPAGPAGPAADQTQSDTDKAAAAALPAATMEYLYDASVDDDAESVRTEADIPAAAVQWALRGAEDAPLADPEAPSSTVDTSGMPTRQSLAGASSAAKAMHSAVGALATMACDSALLAADFDMNAGRRRFMDKYLSNNKATSAFLTEYHTNNGEGAAGSDSNSDSDDADSLLGRVPRWVAAKRSLDSERRSILHGMRGTIGALTAAEPQDVPSALRFHGFDASASRPAGSAGASVPFHAKETDTAADLGQALLWHSLGRQLDLRHNWPTESMRRAEALREAQSTQAPAVVIPPDSGAATPIDGCTGTVAVQGMHPLSDPLPQSVQRFLPSWTGKLPPVPDAVTAFVGAQEAEEDGRLPPPEQGCSVGHALPCHVTRALPAAADLTSALGSALFAWLHVPNSGEEVPSTPAAAWDFYTSQHGAFGATLPVGLPTEPMDAVVAAVQQVLGLPADAQAEAKRAMLLLQRFAQSQRVSLQLVSSSGTDNAVQLFVDTPAMSDTVDISLAARTCVEDHGTVGAACSALQASTDAVFDSISPHVAHMQLAAREARLQWVLPTGTPPSLVRSCWRSQAHAGVDGYTPVLTVVCGASQGLWIPIIPRFLAAARAHRVREMAAMRVRGAVLRSVLNMAHDQHVDVALEAASALAREAIGGGISPLFPSRVAPLVTEVGSKLDGVSLGEYRDVYPVDHPGRFLLARRGEFHDGAAEHEDDEDAMSRRRSSRKRTSTQREGYDDAALEAMLASGDSSADSDDGASDVSDASGGRRMGGKKRGPRGSGPAVPLPEGGWPLVAAKELLTAGKPLYVRSLFTNLMGRLGKSGVKWEVRVRGLLGGKMRYEGCFDNEMEAAHHADKVVRAAYAEVMQPVPIDLVNFSEEGEPLAHTKAAMDWYGKTVTLADIASDSTAQELFKPRGSWTILQQHQLQVYFSTRRRRVDFWPVWGQTVNYNVDQLPTKMKKIHDKYFRKLRGETDDGKRGKKRSSSGGAGGRSAKVPREEGEWKLPTTDYVSKTWLARSDVHMALMKREKPAPIPEDPPAWLAAAIQRALDKGTAKRILS